MNENPPRKNPATLCSRPDTRSALSESKAGSPGNCVEVANGRRALDFVENCRLPFASGGPHRLQYELPVAT